MAEQTGDRSDQPVGNAKAPGGDFLLRWMVASVAGWLVGWVLVGVGMGVAQWLVLRGRVARAGWWVVASVMGWIVGRIAAWFGVGIVAVDVILGQVAGQVAYGVVYGAITGIVLVQLLHQHAGDAKDAMAASA